MPSDDGHQTMGPMGIKNGHHKLINYFHLQFTLDTEEDWQKHWHVKAPERDRGSLENYSDNTIRIHVQYWGKFSDKGQFLEHGRR